MKIAYRYIFTSSGYCITVSQDDYDTLIAHRWVITESGSKTVKYAITEIHGKTVRMHRLIMFGLSPTTLQVDHINGNGLDNRRCNLRQCTGAENAINRKLAACNSTGKTGVNWHERDQKFVAKIRVNKRLIHLGQFVSKEEAIKAREAGEVKYWGKTQRS